MYSSFTYHNKNKRKFLEYENTNLENLRLVFKSVDCSSILIFSFLYKNSQLGALI